MNTYETQEPKSSDPQVAARPLNVLIVGAGIGGLSAATALRRAGHTVHIYESSRFSSEIGAAISVNSNGTRVLRTFGYDTARMRGVPCNWFENRDNTGEFVKKFDLTHVTKREGAEFWMVHRVDLHNELKQLAVGENGVGKPCELHLTSKVVSADCEAGDITLADGQTIHGDLVVGADGIRSVMRKFIADEDHIASPTGISAFRFIVPTEALEKEPEFKFITPDGKDMGMWLCGNPGLDMRIVIYACRDGEILNCAAVHRSIQKYDSEHAWGRPASVDEVKKVFKEFSAYHRLFELGADTLKLYPLCDMPPITTWNKGRACVLGDAAHPMLPHLGQGGCQAIEDGAALGVILPLGTTPAEIPAKLMLYEQIRKSRVDAIQNLSKRAIFDRKSDELDKTLRFIQDHDVIAYSQQSMTTVFV